MLDNQQNMMIDIIIWCEAPDWGDQKIYESSVTPNRSAISLKNGLKHIKYRPFIDPYRQKLIKWAQICHRVGEFCSHSHHQIAEPKLNYWALAAGPLHKPHKKNTRDEGKPTSLSEARDSVVYPPSTFPLCSSESQIAQRIICAQDNGA